MSSKIETTAEEILEEGKDQITEEEKTMIKEFKEEHPIAFKVIIITLIATGAISIVALMALITKWLRSKYGNEDSDETDFEDKTDEEESSD